MSNMNPVFSGIEPNCADDGGSSTPGVDVEQTLLCDIVDGEVVGSAIAVYDYDDETGAPIGPPTFIDPTTGDPYVAQGTLQPCVGEEIDRLIIRLCDVDADGNPTPFLRHFTVDNIDGSLTPVGDTELDGVTAYAPAGTVGTCDVCRTSTSMLLCDVTGDPAPEPTITDTDPTPFAWFCGNTPLPGGGQTVWNGGTLVVPSDPGPQPSCQQTHRDIAAVISAPPPSCDDGSGTCTVTISVDIENLGPTGGYVTDALLYLYDSNGVRISAQGSRFTPVGGSKTLGFTRTVSTADVAAGMTVLLSLETWDNGRGAKSWEISNFEWSVEHSVTDCVNEFVRTITVDCDGELVSVNDTTIDGDPYTVQGDVGKCNEETTPTCHDCETIVLCDTGPEPTVDPASVVVTNDHISEQDALEYTLLTPAQPYLGAVEATALYQGGSIVVPEAPASPCPAAGSYHVIGGRLSAACDIECGDDITVDVTLSMRITNDGPDAGVACYGVLKLLNDGVVVGTDNACGGLAVGASAVFSAGPITVSYRELMAGNLHFGFAIEGCDGGNVKGYTVDQFDLTVDNVQGDFVGCGETFLRTICRDCDGQVASVVDTDLDSNPYTPVGQVGLCKPDDACPSEAVADEQCATTSTLMVCDLPGDGEPDAVVTDTDPTPYTNFAGGEQVDGGAAVLWGGGLLNIPPDDQPPPDGNPQYVRTFAATVQADQPACDTGTATVTASIRVERLGPDDGCRGTGAFRLLVNGTQVDVAGVVTPDTPVGTIQTLEVTAQVPAADLAAGNVELLGLFETYHRAPGSCPNGSAPDGARMGGWDVDQFTISTVYDQEGCDTQFLRNVTVDCDGNVTSVNDTTLEGDPYTVQGEVGQCVSNGTPAPNETCSDCETIVLCDDATDDPNIIHGVGSSGTLHNGVTWESVGEADYPQNSEEDSPEGSWWPAVSTFPNPVNGRNTWRFDRPVTVEFSVYMRWFDYANSTDPSATNEMLLPEGLEVVHLPDGFHWDATTNILSVDDSRGDPGNEPCENLADPTIAESARFRTTRDVMEVFAEYQGLRISTCGRFGAHRVGAFEVTPRAEFLRTICRDCDGQVVSVTDTTLDGFTPYTLRGVPKLCGVEATGGGQPIEFDPGVDVEVTRRCTFDIDGRQMGQVFYVRGYDRETGDFLFERTENEDGSTPATIPPGGYIGECIEQQHTIQAGGINILAGNTAPVELSNLYPGLQSATLVVIGGVVEVSAFNGISQVPAGVSVTWSANDTDDTVLRSLTFTGTDADTHFYIAFTYKLRDQGIR